MGGLGFRNFYNFNLVMLEKQNWRLIANLDALMCKILNTKYFPRGIFLMLSLEIIQSLHKGASGVFRHCWFEVSDEKLGMVVGLRFGGEPWLCDPPNFNIQSPVVPTLSEIIVKDPLFQVVMNRTWTCCVSCLLIGTRRLFPAFRHPA